MSMELIVIWNVLFMVQNSYSMIVNGGQELLQAVFQIPFFIKTKKYRLQWVNVDFCGLVTWFIVCYL